VGAKSYFDKGLARDDYYTKDEIIGRWGGKGAERLGLDGAVTPEAFHSLCDNINPVSGEKLTARTRENRTVGYDFNFHAPKSLSVLYTLSGDERLLDAFRSSVKDTMQELEAEVKTRVRRGGANEERTTGNLVYGEFVHLTSRPVGGVPDPHLHAHCFVFNATHDQVEDKWKAAQFRDVVRDAPYWEAAFHARLSRSVAELGYGVERTRNGWEVAGFERATLEKFSRRTAQIEEAAKAKGITSAEEKAELGARTREAKGESRLLADLEKEWRSRLSPDERDSFARVAAGRVKTAEPAVTVGDTVTHAMKHGFERASVVAEKRLMATALKRGYGSSVKVEDVKQAFAAAGEFIRRRIDGQVLCTTKEALAEEAAVIGFARDGRGTCKALAKEDVELKALHLNAEQENAVRHVLTSSDRVMLIRGAAGTGKTTLLRAADEEVRARGQEIHVFAPTSEATAVLRKEGFGEAQTVARLLADPEAQSLVGGGIILVDEAGLVGSRDMKKVFDVAKEQQARVILVADDRQHAAVPRGTPFKLLQTHAGIKPAEVKTIMRQQEREYRAAVECLSRGDLAGGLERLDRMGAIEAIPDDKRHLRLATDYLSAVKDGKSALVVAPTHAEGRAVTAAIREKLQEEGKLDKERTFRQHASFGMTEAMRADPVNLRAGDVVQFHQNARGHFRKGEQWRVRGHDEEGRVLVAQGYGRSKVLPLDQARHYDVYESQELKLAKGDRLRITKNGVGPDKKRLINGTLHTVQGFNRFGHIVLDNGQVVAKDYGNIAHGYATTSHASQGKTVDRVFVGMGRESYPATSREGLYVSVSRGRESCRIYTQDKRELFEAVSRSDSRMSATELAAGPKPAEEAKGRLRLLRNGEAVRRMEFERLRRVMNAVREKAAAIRQRLEENRERQRER